MAVKRRSVKTEDKSARATAQKDQPIVLAALAMRNKIVKIITLGKIPSILSVVFYLIWILIGLFFLWFVWANFRMGAFDALMTKSKSSATEQASGQAQPPTETTVPGIGKVNIDCVQKSLNEQAIVKIVQEKSNKSLSDDEKKKLDACIVNKTEASPTASASPKQ